MDLHIHTHIYGPTYLHLHTFAQICRVVHWKQASAMRCSIQINTTPKANLLIHKKSDRFDFDQLFFILRERKWPDLTRWQCDQIWSNFTIKHNFKRLWPFLE